MIDLLDVQVGFELWIRFENGTSPVTRLIVFASINGHMKRVGRSRNFNSNGPLKGVKRDLYEGGIRVPMICFSRPGKIIT